MGHMRAFCALRDCELRPDASLHAIIKSHYTLPKHPKWILISYMTASAAQVGGDEHAGDTNAQSPRHRGAGLQGVDCLGLLLARL